MALTLQEVVGLVQGAAAAGLISQAAAALQIQQASQRFASDPAEAASAYAGAPEVFNTVPGAAALLLRESGAGAAITASAQQGPSAALGQQTPITGWREGQMRWDSTAPGGQGWVLMGGQWRPADQWGRVLPGYEPTMATIPPIGTPNVSTMPTVPAAGTVPGAVNPADLNITPSAGGGTGLGLGGATNVPLDVEAQRRLVFENESNAGAFTRYMLGRQGATPWAQPVREAAQSRGALLSNLAPLLGYGGGNEGSFFDYYNRNFGSGIPSREALNARLRELTQASSVQPTEWTSQQAHTIAPFLNETGEFQQERARDAMIAAAQARVNPSLRSSYEGLLRRLYREQQATTPENPWLSYSQGKGLF